MRQFQLELTMIDGGVWFVDPDLLGSFNVPENPESFIGNYLRGSRGPLLRVNSVATLDGDEIFINPAMIVSMRVIYI